MSFDGSGNYTVPAGTQGVSGQVIDATKYNAFLTDLQIAVSKCMVRDGQSAGQANISMGGFRLTNLSAGTTDTDSARVGQLYALPKGSYTPSGLPSFAATLTLDVSVTNVFEVATLTGNVTSLVLQNPQAGQTVNIRFAQDATGGRTIAAPAGSLIALSFDTRPSTISWLILTYSGLGARWEGSWTTVSP